ncbi:MAG: hypothetical protein ABL311_04725 [Nitratireductor rhodophyticola]|uniref:hypothetical protein n=1 Tax=Nitratireductor rhodophyticola TaxID=2854036 RepID=UPI0032D9A738
MPGSTEAQVARLDERLNSIERLLVSLSNEMKSASDSRKKVYEAQEATARDLIRISHRLENVENEVKAIRPTSEEYLRTRDQVRGAGTLGAWLWKVGMVLIAVAGWIVSAYTWLTGRTPP